jgi:ABC-type multidrug transport system permease subunit
MYMGLFGVNNTSTCHFGPDTLGVSILTISVLGFFILFSVATFLATREDKIFSEKNQDTLERNMLDPTFRLLTILASASIINKFVIASLLYLSALLLCLINYFLCSCILLYINLCLVLIPTIVLFITLCICLFKARVVTPKEVKLIVNQSESTF